jgi:hypothetical protein
MRRKTVAGLGMTTFLLVAIACGSGTGGPSAELPSDALDVPSDTPDVPEDTPADPGGDVDPGDPGPFTWPLPTGPVSITPSPDWKNRVAFPDDPFLVRDYDGNYRPLPGFVKFAVLVRDPTKVYFQNGATFKFHYEFATQRLDPFLDMTRPEFDAVSLNAAGQEVILGALITPPRDGIREAGIQLVRQDAYHPEMVRTVVDLVRAAIDADGPLTTYYFPTFEQQDSAARWSPWLHERGVDVSSVARWAESSSCYVNGWAMGRLVELAGTDIRQAYTDGRLGPTDILLTDGVPAEVPYVAGILSTQPSTPNSHVAILADAFRIPFAYLATDADRAAARALAGRPVALRVEGLWGCAVRLADATDLSAQMRDEVVAMKQVPVADVPARLSPGRLWRVTDELGDGDVKSYGGKASHYGILRRAIPDHTDPAIALSFDLFDAFLAQAVQGGKTLRQAIDERLAGLAWPPDMARVATDLAWVRGQILAAPLPDALRTDLLAALQQQSFFDPGLRLRFRSSTNVEDVETFVGAGLYESASGCLLDDTDADPAGPSACPPGPKNEKPVADAVRTVLASFWGDNAFLERLRRGVNEADVGMAILVHHSYPDADELANGVAVVTHSSDGSNQVDFVTQAGAVSVTNPDGSAIPEVVDGYSGFGTLYLAVMTRSSLVPLGGTVMDWEQDYRDLAALLFQATDAYGVETGQSAYVLDFEYKKMRPGHLVVKQVRQLPQPTFAPPTRQVILPGTYRVCVNQGEYGDVLANHRLKSEWTVRTRGLWSDALGTDSFLADVAFEGMEEGVLTTFQGDPATFPGFVHGKQSEVVTDGFTRGQGAAQRTLSLVTQMPMQIFESSGPFLWWNDLYLTLQADYATPHPAWNSWDPLVTTVSTESARLAACTSKDDVTGAYPRQERTWDLGDGVSANVSWWWPPSPTGPTAGYTAPLVAWDATTLTGLTTEPLDLSSSWARSYRPGHHNFSEDFLFEPRLDPAVTPAQVGELEARGIRALLITADQWTGPSAASVMAPDGTLSPWTHLPPK